MRVLCCRMDLLPYSCIQSRNKIHHFEADPDFALLRMLFFTFSCETTIATIGGRSIARLPTSGLMGWFVCTCSILFWYFESSLPLLLAMMGKFVMPRCGFLLSFLWNLRVSCLENLVSLGFNSKGIILSTELFTFISPAGCQTVGITSGCDELGCQACPTGSEPAQLNCSRPPSTTQACSKSNSAVLALYF